MSRRPPNKNNRREYQLDSADTCDSWKEKRWTTVLRNLRTALDHGRLGGTGYLPTLLADQGVEHSAGASFAPAPEHFDPEDISEMFEHAHELGMFTVP